MPVVLSWVPRNGEGSASLIRQIRHTAVVSKDGDSELQRESGCRGTVGFWQPVVQVERCDAASSGALQPLFAGRVPCALYLNS